MPVVHAVAPELCAWSRALSCTVSFVAHAAPSLVHVPKPIMYGKVFCLNKKTSPLSQLRHDRDSYSWEKPCRNTRRPLSRPKTSWPIPNPAATRNFCRYTRPKKLYHDRESLYLDPNLPACLGTLSRHGDPYPDTEPESSIACASQPCVHSCRMHLGRVVCLA